MQFSGIPKQQQQQQQPMPQQPYYQQNKLQSNYELSFSQMQQSRAQPTTNPYMGYGGMYGNAVQVSPINEDFY